MSTNQQVRLFPNSKNNLTVAQYDATAKVWEIFCEANDNGYIGCADSLEEAKTVSSDWFSESRSVFN